MKAFKVCESITSPGNIFQSVADLMVKKFFRYSRLAFFVITLLLFLLVSRLFNSKLYQCREKLDILSQVECNSRLLKSHMRLRKIGPITIGSRVRDIISCVFVPHSVGANSVHLRHETTNRVTA